MVDSGTWIQSGNACLKFQLCGTKHRPPGLEIDGLVDTGFTGFVHLPIQFAFRLGLPLEGTTSSTLADGSTLNELTALGLASFGGDAKQGTIILSASANEVLVGMDFLRVFDLSLMILDQLVLLPPRAEVRQTIEDTLKEIKKRQGTPPSQPGSAR